MVTEAVLLCMATVWMHNGLAHDWRNMAMKMLQKDEG